MLLKESCRQEARKLRARLTEERVVFEREEEAVSALAIEGDGSEPITADES
ncbi:ATP-dependent Clp protease%2C ATP-binding subunit ClpC [Chlamydia trachomatis]|nr:ATP-dependent Clp protease%2C ATP-binding subunit ClpC [Chlamydia trachomatis]